MKLAQSSSMHGLASYCKTVVTTTADYGVEFGLNTVQPVRLRKVFSLADRNGRAASSRADRDARANLFAGHGCGWVSLIANGCVGFFCFYSPFPAE